MSTVIAPEIPLGAQSLTLVPTSWQVATSDGRVVGTINLYGDYYAAHHHPAAGGHHPCQVEWPGPVPTDLGQAIAQLLACDADPVQCAEIARRQAERDQLRAVR